MTTNTRTHILKPGVVPERPRIWYRRSKSGKRLFIRLLDWNEATFRSLKRLLAENDVDAEAAKAKFGELGAMQVPGYLYPILSRYYRMIELSLEDWLRPGPEEEA